MPSFEARSEGGFKGNWHISLRMTSSFSSGPDQRTRNDSAAALAVDASFTHDYPRPLMFVVFEVIAILEGKLLSLSPYADLDDTEKAPLPFADRRDAGVGLLWLDTPWPVGKERNVSFEVPSRAEAYFVLSSAFKSKKDVNLLILPHAVGYDLQDAIPLLADAVVRETDRMTVAQRLSHALGRRYRYLADDGHWKMPKDVPEILPPAAWSEQLTVKHMAPSGHTEKGARIVFVNRAAGQRKVRVSGDGSTQWVTVQPGSRAVIDVRLEPVNWAELLAGVPVPKNWTLAVLEQKRRYPDKLPEIDKPDSLLETLDARYTTHTMRLDGGNEYVMEIGSR
jgi:hypothetical protein